MAISCYDSILELVYYKFWKFVVVWIQFLHYTINRKLFNQKKKNGIETILSRFIPVHWTDQNDSFGLVTQEMHKNHPWHLSFYPLWHGIKAQQPSSLNSILAGYIVYKFIIKFKISAHLKWACVLIIHQAQGNEAS